MKKRLLSLFMVLCIIMPMAFTVSAEDYELIYELNLQEMDLGKIVEKHRTNYTEKATVDVVESEDKKERWIEVRDNDPAAQVGFRDVFRAFKEKRTVTFDIRNLSLSEASPSIYYGMAVYLMAKAVPQYYTGSKYVDMPNGSIPLDEWTNVTIIVDGEKDTYDIYTDGLLVGDDLPPREGKLIYDASAFSIITDKAKYTSYDLKNYKVYKGEYIPPLAEKMKEVLINPDRQLVNYSDAGARLNAALPNAVAMTVGNSMARVNNKYVNIDPDNVYVAPFITPDGYTLVPTRFTAETIGAEVEVVSSTCFKFSKDGTVMEINMGDKNAIINGVAKEMPTTPVIKHDRLFIPLRFAAETFGKNVFWDDRGLIIISDGEVVKAGQEDIIKPLINEIRSRTSIFGNKKYSDVNFSARFFRYASTEWGSMDAAKRFMATVNRWTYTIEGDDAIKFSDQGILQQGTLNPNPTGEAATPGGAKDARAYFLSGDLVTRADGMAGWGCFNKPTFWENMKERIRSGIDKGMFVWQFDDYPINSAYRLGGCMCDYCIEAFRNYLNTDATPDELQMLAAEGITDVKNFNLREWLASQGVTHENDYPKVQNSAVATVRGKFNAKRMYEVHRDIRAYMKEYSGSESFYSVNMNNTLEKSTSPSMDYTETYQLANGVMGETDGAYTTPNTIYSLMHIVNSIGLDNVISPLPKDTASKQNMYSGIAMCYATGQQMLVPWDDWLFGNTRYYANLEELEGAYEMAREYPFLLDNYEMPEAVGYIVDLDKAWKTNSDKFQQMLDNGTASRGIIVQKSKKLPITFESTNLEGLQAIVGPENMAGLTDEEKAKITNSGIVYVNETDAATVGWLENTYWTARDNKDNVYTVLRQNELYDNAPTVVHAVGYNEGETLYNVEIEMNNLYLPEGDNLKINVYQPGTNYKTYNVAKGNSTTKFTIPSMNRWTILEVCGPNTIRREVAFDLGEGYNGIGMGTRISKDKAYGTINDFTIVTYSEGINSVTHGDNGTQDEAAFVYGRMDSSLVKSAFVSAGFGAADGEHGVMIRDGIYSNARFVALTYDNAKGLRLAERKRTDKAVLYKELGNEKPAYMKLERHGGEYIAYTSADGVNYTEVARSQMEFAAPVGGVFATSPNGSRAECKVHSFMVSDGKFPSEEFVKFKIKYEDGTIDLVKRGAKLEATLDAETYKNIKLTDVQTEYSSSNPAVLEIKPDGTLLPVSTGTATITAVAKMGLKKISASTNITVVAGNPVMFEESFDSEVWPAYMSTPALAMPGVKDGVLRAITEYTGVECDMKFTFEQQNMPTVFEFDFKAHYGNDQPTTGARIIYANNQAISLVSNPNGSVNWFFGSEQTTVGKITPDEWHHIKIEANYVEQWCNVYIDGEKIVDKGETRRPLTPDGTVTIGAWRIGTDSCYEWDNFKFYYVAEFTD